MDNQEYLDFTNMSHFEKEKALIPYILSVLQEAGGQLDRQQIIERICTKSDSIAAFANDKKVSKKTGVMYSQFVFKFNFALKNLLIAGFITYEKRNPSVTLTSKGIGADIAHFDVEKEVYGISSKYWSERRKNRAPELEEEVSNEETGQEEQYREDFKNRLLDAIAKMSPKKFEQFSRQLIGKMGVEFTSTGVQISNDGGIDGYGYHRDLDDFRTTRVVIQCKRYNTGDVGSTEIDRFLGAMNKFQADYGIFITNSRYTTAAREAARAGTPITLIDGNDLVRLVIKYQLHVRPIMTYELLDFYDEESSE